MTIGFALIFILLLMWLLMAAPLGVRTVSRQFTVALSPEKVWEAVHPFGASYDWNRTTQSVTQTGPTTGHMVTTHTGRDGNPIEREFELESFGEHAYRLRYTSDSSLSQDFWADHFMDVKVRAADADSSIVTIAETDSYRGAAFLVFRFFALRRMALKLQKWARTGSYKPGGLFDHPLTQFGLAIVSALLLWPLFGLTLNGFLLASAMTAIVGLHELGHMAAFRLMGHRTARMVFIPILGGIALGGRPYDTHFEIGFSALMGAGFSAFVAAASMWFHAGGSGALSGETLHAITVFALMISLFNLANLIPVWKFDGGQVLRQVFRSRMGLAMSAFVALGWFVVTGLAVGIELNMMLAIAAVFSVLSIMTAQSGVRPKTPLTPMSGSERLAILAAFAAVFATHATVFTWSAGQLIG